MKRAGIAIERGRSPHPTTHKERPTATNPESAMTCAALIPINRVTIWA